MAIVKVVVNNDPNFLQSVPDKTTPVRWDAKIETDPGNQIMTEYYNQIYGAEEAVRALESLSILHQRVSAMESLSETSGKMVNLHLVHEQHALGFKDVVSLESFNNKQVALEGIVSLLQRIIDAIINTFKAIWNFVIGMFKTTRRETINNKAEKVKDAVKDVSTVRDVKNPESENHQLRAFQYLGHKFSIQDLIHEADHIHSVVQLGNQIIKEFGQVAKHIAAEIDKAVNGTYDAENYIQASKRCQDLYQKFFAVFVTKIPEFTKPQYYSEEITKAVENFQLSKSQTKNIRAFSGFSFGQVFAAVPHYTPDGFESYDFRPMERNYEDSFQPTCSISSMGQISSYGEKSVGIWNEIMKHDDDVRETLQNHSVADAVERLGNKIKGEDNMNNAAYQLANCGLIASHIVGGLVKLVLMMEDTSSRHMDCASALLKEQQ